MLAGLAVGSFILRPKTEPKDPQDVFVLSYVFGSGTIQHLIICVNGIPLEFHYKPEPSRTFPSVLALLASSPFVDQRALAPTCIETWTGRVMSRTTSSASSRRSMSSGSTSAMQIRCAPRCHICTGTVLTPATSAPALGSLLPRRHQVDPAVGLHVPLLLVAPAERRGQHDVGTVRHDSRSMASVRVRTSHSRHRGYAMEPTGTCTLTTEYSAAMQPAPQRRLASQQSTCNTL